MSKRYTLAPAAILLCASAASADVKSGVDAWNQGDYARAIEEWRPLAISGNPDAQFNLGQAYKLGRGVTLDLPVALEWFRKASEKGHEKAKDNLGLLLFQQGRREESMPYIKASSDRGEPRAQYVYGTALFNGDLAPRDWVKAYALMTRASKAGVSQAAASLAQMDAYIPEEQRKQGLELATGLSSAPQLAQATPPKAPAVAPAPRAAPPHKPAPAPAAQQLPVAAADGPSDRPPVTKRNPAPARPQPPIQTAAPAPTPAPASAGRYRIQLGAFREGSRAPALWKSVSAKVSGLSAFQPSYVVTNGLTRLLVGPVGSSSEAQQLCARIKPTGTPCVVQGN